MKKFYNFLMQTLLYVLLAASAKATTIAVTYDSTSYTFKTCNVKNVTAQFLLPAGNHQISIRDSINLPCGSSSCTATQLTLFHIVSSIPALSSDFTYDTSTQSWVIELDSNIDINYTITYSIKLDCGLIPTCFDSATSSIKLFQKWKDSVSSDTINVNSTGNNILQSPVFYPHFEERTADKFFGNYLDTVPIYHVYLNTGNTDGNIQFSFNPSPYNTCASILLDSVKYAVGVDSPSTLTYTNSLINGWNTVLVPVNQALVIREDVIITGCLNSTCSHQKDTFIWKCNYPDSTIFCSECQHIYNHEYAIQKATGDSITITRLLPSSSTASLDYSCMGTKVQWRYSIKNTGEANFPKAHIRLFNNSSLPPNQLLLIDTSDVKIFPHLSSNSAWNDTITLNSNALCHDSLQIPNPLGEITIYVTNFMKGDSMIIEFKTFRCCEENDLILSQYPGLNYGSWRLEAYGNHSCGQDSIIAAGSDFINGYPGNPNWGMNLDYFPLVSDLTVPHDSLFGPSTPLLFVDESSLSATYFANYQLLGCNGNPANCGMHGYFRVHINCDPGLVIDTPLVQMVNYPLDSTRTWNPVYHYSTLPPNSCDTADYFFYFDLSDTNAFALVHRGRLNFRLRSCCGAYNEAFSHYTIDYHLLANPSGTCDSLIFPPGDTLPPICSYGNCCYLFLKNTGDKIAVRCPGCKAPGLEVNSYSMKRIINLSAKDSNNNGAADIPLAVIDSAYLNTYGSLMRTTFANHGDIIEDLMSGHFQDGDATIFPNPGYTYQQMLNDSGVLNFLQLSRTFTLADSAQMSITPFHFKFYVDIPASLGNDSCIDCAEYGAIDTSYRTIHIIEVFAAQMSNYVQYDPSKFRVFFTFDATANNPTHNMYQNEIYHDLVNEFNGYMPYQRYRMKTDYSVCGYFTPPRFDVQTTEEQQQQAEIMNLMFLCGQQLPPLATDTSPTMPNDSSDLAYHGDTISPVFNQAFANHYRFICAGMGGRFYFRVCKCNG
jgi:hypothetical protein